MATTIPEEFSKDELVYKTLLESTLAIPWRIDWVTKKYTYIGPQIESLLGWTPESWETVQDWADRIHPDERAQTYGYCVAQSLAGIDHEADYRALTKDKGFVWIREVVHVVRKPDGEVEALIGFMFDISERKKNEEKLLQLQRELEALSFQDGLTGIANRRMFDARLELEWANACRTGQPLSLLLLDIDHFKQFNDFYGHLEGDACLTRCAQALHAVATRPRDVVARFGGEEFVILLPESSHSATQKLAARCHEAIAELRIEHDKSSVAPCVTASIGAVTFHPNDRLAPKTLLQEADQLLYVAKQNGRNRTAFQVP